MSSKPRTRTRSRSAGKSLGSMFEPLEGRVLLSGLPAMVDNGIGGGGGMFQVTASPYDSQYMYITCDMSGDYRSVNGGSTWQMINYKQIDTSLGLRPAFSVARTYWVDQGQGDLRYSDDRGITWSPLLTNSAPWPDAITQLGAISGAPDKVFVGTASGLWQSQNGGATWTQAASGNCTGIITIGQRVYATVGTTLKSSPDGGLTWASITVTGAGSHALTKVAGAQVGSAEPYLFVIADQVGVIRSTDGGATWGTVQPWNSQSDIMMPQGQTQKVYTAQYNVVSGLMWASTNGGTSWTSIFKMYGTGANVQVSWLQSQLHWGYVIFNGGISVAPSDPNIMFVSAGGDLYKSTNGGTSWAPAMAVDLAGGWHQSIGLEVTAAWNYEWDPFNYNNQYACYSDIGVTRSNNAGASWTWSDTGNPWTNTMYDLEFDPSVSGRIYGAASTLHEIPTWIAVDDSTNDQGGVVISNNGGVSWTPLGTGLPNQPCTDILVDPTSPVSARVLYATMYYSGVWKSVDGGATWVQKPGVGFSNNHHATHLYRDAATGTLYCLVTTTRTSSGTLIPGGLWKSGDGGDNWQQITAGMFVWPTEAAIVDANTIYISASSAGVNPQGGIWKTTTGGHGWTQVLTDAQLEVWHTNAYAQALTVKVHPDNPNIVYCGTLDAGLWVSQNAGATWTPFTNLPFRGPTNIAFDPQDHTQIYVTTDGGGIWHGYYLPALPGDANADGTVNFRDYIVLEANFGKTGTSFSQGDFNADQKVDFKDYVILESHFNASIYSAPEVVPLSLLAGTTTASATAQPATQEQVRQFLLPAAMTGSPAKLPARLGKLRLAKAMGSTSNADGTVTLL